MHVSYRDQSKERIFRKKHKAGGYGGFSKLILEEGRSEVNSSDWDKPSQTRHDLNVDVREASAGAVAVTNCESNDACEAEHRRVKALYVAFVRLLL